MFIFAARSFSKICLSDFKKLCSLAHTAADLLSGNWTLKIMVTQQWKLANGLKNQKREHGHSGETLSSTAKKKTKNCEEAKLL